MPKNRKTRKQKIRASIRQRTAITTAVQTSSITTTELQPTIKTPEKFSLQPSSLHSSFGTIQAHTYLKGELLKTSLLSTGIIIAELLLFFLVRNHILVLPYVSY